LTHSVFEARQLRLMAARTGVVTQMGNQHRSGQNLKGARYLLRKGELGAIREAHAWSDRPIWPQGMDRPTNVSEPPPHLDWDLWLGVAPQRPFVEGAYHAFNWRGFWDFGTGALGDMGCHLMDPILHGLDLPAPATIVADGPPPHPDTAPKWSQVTWEFPASPTRPALKLTWYDGKKLPPPELYPLPKGRKLPANGALFVGEQATMFVNQDTGPWIIAPDHFADLVVTDVEAENHYQQWTKACKGEGKTISGFDTAGPLTETVLLGNVAYRLGKRIRWNSENLTVRGVPGAAELLRRPYRKGWEVAWLG
jgi:predicted dehydrogenase